jgi:hypothetical protein
LPREAVVVAAIGRELTRRGAWWFNVHGSALGRGGLPDIHAVYRGVPLAIEAKGTGGRPSRRQLFELDRARRAGARAILADDVTAVQAVLDEIEGGT